MITGTVVTAAGAERKKGGRITSQRDVDGAAEPVGTGTGCQGGYSAKGKHCLQATLVCTLDTSTRTSILHIKVNICN